MFEYWAIMTLINQTGITVFRAIAAIGRAVVLCNVLAFIYIAYALLFCGFIIPLGREPCLASSRYCHASHPKLMPSCSRSIEGYRINHVKSQSAAHL